MNKMKLLMLLILAATGMTVSAADAGFEFVVSDDDKTLTIKGYGDLTTCGNPDTPVFAAAANGHIYIDQWGNKTKVAIGEVYEPSTTYYAAIREYSQVFNGGAPQSWQNGVGEVKSNNSVTTYAVSENDRLYRSQDGGSTIELLSIGTYTYNSGDLFYNASYNTTYQQIEDNATYFAEHATFIEGKPFNQELQEKINSGAYTKVVFENTGSGELIIDPNISQKILFPYVQENQYYGTYITNTNIETLDMGEATLKLSEGQSFADVVSKPNGDGSLCNLTNFTIPMMPKDEDGKMVLPDFALSAKFPNNSNLGTLTVPVGYTELGNGSLALNAKITTINLPEGLKKIDYQAFSMNTALTNLNITGAPVEGRSIVLPSSLEEIGKEAFASTAIASTKDDPFILPSGLKKVKASAFVNLTNLKFLELNEGLEYVGNTAFGLDHEVHDQTTITFPSTIKYLGPGSFISRWYQDIYFTGKTAPVCPVGKPAFDDWGNVTAFSANTQMGNNGFNANKTEGSTSDDASTGYANRENYINNGYYFSILHFPAGLTDDQAKTYRDITRRYVTAKGNEQDTSGNTFYSGGNIATLTDPVTGETFGSAFKESADGEKSSLVYYMSGKDAPLYSYTYSGNVQPGYIDTYLGEQQIWPSQSQWVRSFVTVANGVEWDGVTVYRPTLTEEIFNLMKEDGLFVQKNGLDYTQGNPRTPNEGDKTQGGYELSLEGKTFESLTTEERDYLSLILYQGTRRFVLSNGSPYEIPFKMEMEAGRWWSICLPFNMTKKQIDEVFGVGTHVCLFSGVKRTDGDDKLLRLEFINDVYHHKTERTVEKLGDGSALKYTYGANYSTSNPEPEDDDIVIYARESYMIYPMAENDDASEKAIRNFGTPDFAVGDPLPTMIQANSKTPYTIDGEDVAYRFIGNFNTTASYDEAGNSVPVKIPRYSYAYGQSGGVTKFFILNKDNAVWTPFKSIVQNLGHDFGLSDWENFFQKSPAGAKQVSVFGLDEYLTGVENVIIEVSSDNGVDKAVYSINGSYVGDSLQGLAPGVYVQQGKAYIVK